MQVANVCSYLFCDNQINCMFGVFDRDDLSVTVAWGNWWLIQWWQSEFFVSILISRFLFQMLLLRKSYQDELALLIPSEVACLWWLDCAIEWRCALRYETYRFMYVCTYFKRSWNALQSVAFWFHLGAKCGHHFPWLRLGMHLHTLQLVRDSAWKSARVIVGVWLQ